MVNDNHLSMRSSVRLHSRENELCLTRLSPSYWSVPTCAKPNPPVGVMSVQLTEFKICRQLTSVLYKEEEEKKKGNQSRASVYWLPVPSGVRNELMRANAAATMTSEQKTISMAALYADDTNGSQRKTKCVSAPERSSGFDENESVSMRR